MAIQTWGWMDEWMDCLYGWMDRLFTCHRELPDKRKRPQRRFIDVVKKDLQRV